MEVTMFGVAADFIRNFGGIYSNDRYDRQLIVCDSPGSL